MKFVLDLLVFSIFICGLTYLFIFISVQRNIKWFKNASAEGKYADFHGKKIFYRVKGKGEPVVVVLNDIGSSQAEWWPIQNEVAQKFRMITWDRAGYDWSTPEEDLRSCAKICDELDSILKFERIKKPIFLVANGTGTVYARYYAMTHPLNVMGALFISPILLQYSHWLNTINETEECHNVFERTQKKRKYASRGIFRLLPPVMGYKLDRRYKRHIVEHYTKVENYDTIHLELSQIQNNLIEIEKAGAFPPIPLKILYPSNESLIREWIRSGTPEYSSRQLGRLHNELSGDILTLSPKADICEIEGTGEYIHLSKPDIVVKEIFEMVME